MNGDDDSIATTKGTQAAPAFMPHGSWLMAHGSWLIPSSASICGEVFSGMTLPSAAKERRPGSTCARPACALHITIERTMTSDARFDDARGAADADARAHPGGTPLRTHRGSLSGTPWRSIENGRGSHGPAASDILGRTSRRSNRLLNRCATRRGIRGRTGVASGFGSHASRVNVRATQPGANRFSARRSDRSPSAAPTCQVVEFLSPTRRLTSYAGGATRSDPLRCVLHTLYDPPARS